VDPGELKTEVEAVDVELKTEVEVIDTGKLKVEVEAMDAERKNLCLNSIVS